MYLIPIYPLDFLPPPPPPYRRKKERKEKKVGNKQRKNDRQKTKEQNEGEKKDSKERKKKKSMHMSSFTWPNFRNTGRALRFSCAFCNWLISSCAPTDIANIASAVKRSRIALIAHSIARYFWGNIEPAPMVKPTCGLLVVCHALAVIAVSGTITIGASK